MGGEIIWDGSGDEFPDLAPVITADHEKYDRPLACERLRRVTNGFAERMWISGYPAQSLIVVTCPAVRDHRGYEMPGAVRTLPVGYRDLASEAAFLHRFERVVDSYEDHGWVCVPEEATC